MMIVCSLVAILVCTIIFGAYWIVRTVKDLQSTCCPTVKIIEDKSIEDTQIAEVDTHRCAMVAKPKRGRPKKVQEV